MSRGMKIGLVVVVVLVLVGGGVVAFRINKKKNAGTEVRMEQVGAARPGERGDGQRKDRGQDLGRHQRRHHRPDHPHRGARGRPGEEGPVPDPDRPGAVPGGGLPGRGRRRLDRGHAAADPGQPRPGRAGAGTGPGSSRQLGRQPDRAGGRRAGPDRATTWREATYQATRAQLEQARAGLQEARDNLAKTRLISPIAGRVVRLAVEEGEVAVPGTFSRETGLLMTIADLSVILAKVQVDETDVVRLAAERLGGGHHRRLPRHHLRRAG